MGEFCSDFFVFIVPCGGFCFWHYLRISFPLFKKKAAEKGNGKNTVKLSLTMLWAILHQKRLNKFGGFGHSVIVGLGYIGWTQVHVLVVVVHTHRMYSSNRHIVNNESICNIVLLL